MRNFTLLFLILSVCSVSAQTFTTLNNSQHVFFLTDSFGAQLYPDIYEPNLFYQPYLDSSIIAYEIDSTYIDSSSSEVYLFNKMHRYEEYSLLILTCEASSFMGKSMKKNTEVGTETYHNDLLEPIVYKTNAQLGESWLMFDGVWGSCMATLDSSFYIDTVLGHADTVYSIICDIDNFGPASSKRTDTILVGKRSGLIKMYSHYLYPTRSKPINLCGTSYPVVGITSADDYEYYNFNIGDEFHAHREWGVPMESYSYSKEIYKILDRAENDSCVILYRDVEICLCWNCSGNTNYSNHLDTVKIRKNHRELLPLESGNFVYFSQGSLIEEQAFEFDTYNLNNTWGIPIERPILECIGSDSDWPAGKLEFVKGLGMTDGRIMLSYVHGGNYEQINLTYYSVNGKSEGIPFDLSDCALGTQENTLFEDLSLVPNPSHGSFAVEGINNYSEGFILEIRNLQGKVVYFQQNYLGKVIDNHTFPVGLYFVSLLNSDGKRSFTNQLLVLR